MNRRGSELIGKRAKNALHRFANVVGFDVSRHGGPRQAHYDLVTLLRAHRVDLVLDVGANVGQYGGLLFKAGFEGSVLSFEPLFGSHAALVRRAGKQSRWHVADRCALGDREAEVDINVSGISQCSSLLPMLRAHLDAMPESSYIGKEAVKLRRLDRIAHPLIEKSERLFLKIDSQGYERQIVDGAAGLRAKIEGYQLEMTLQPLYEGQPTFSSMIDLMTTLGCDLAYVVPGLINYESGLMLSFDGSFLKSKAIGS